MNITCIANMMDPSASLLDSLYTHVGYNSFRAERPRAYMRGIIDRRLVLVHDWFILCLLRDTYTHTRCCHNFTALYGLPPVSIV